MGLSSLRNKFDIFGTPVTLQVNKNGTYTTWTGFFTTLLTAFLVLGFGTYKVGVMINHEDTYYRTSRIKNLAMDSNQTVTFNDPTNGFGMVFVIYHITFGVLSEFAEFGQFKGSSISFDLQEDGTNVIIYNEFALHPCTEKELSALFREQDID